MLGKPIVITSVHLACTIFEVKFELGLLTFAGMKIKRLYINNYKSLVDFELLEPNPFSVFVGPNAAGKSNVFEALEFLSRAFEINFYAVRSFSQQNGFLNFAAKSIHKDLEIYPLDLKLFMDDFTLEYPITFIQENGKVRVEGEGTVAKIEEGEDPVEFEKRRRDFSKRFNRIFIGSKKPLEINLPDKLNFEASNLEPILHRILQDEIKREEISEWMESLIPGLEKVEVAKSDLSGDYFLRIFEKNLPDPIGKNLISDGTYNILALLTAVYQSDEPQFLCIEEPENGLNPYVVRTLVDFFRTVCEEKGHYIWLNTHSATLVRALKPHEIILVDKIDGVTRSKQIRKDFNLHGLTTDEAWLSNAFGGGLPW